MNKPSFLSGSEDSISPVIGVVFLVVITIVLSAVVFTLISPENPKTAREDNTVFSFEEGENAVQANAISVDDDRGGELRVNGSEVATYTDDNTGKTIGLSNVNGDSTISVVPNGSEEAIQVYRPSSEVGDPSKPIEITNPSPGDGESSGDGGGVGTVSNNFDNGTFFGTGTQGSLEIEASNRIRELTDYDLKNAIHVGNLDNGREAILMTDSSADERRYLKNIEENSIKYVSNMETNEYKEMDKIPSRNTLRDKLTLNSTDVLRLPKNTDAITRDDSGGYYIMLFKQTSGGSNSDIPLRSVIYHVNSDNSVEIVTDEIKKPIRYNGIVHQDSSLYLLHSETQPPYRGDSTVDTFLATSDTTVMEINASNGDLKRNVSVADNLYMVDKTENGEVIVNTDRVFGEQLERGRLGVLDLSSLSVEYMSDTAEGVSKADYISSKGDTVYYKKSESSSIEAPTQVKIMKYDISSDSKVELYSVVGKLVDNEIVAANQEKILYKIEGELYSANYDELDKPTKVKISIPETEFLSVGEVQDDKIRYLNSGDKIFMNIEKGGSFTGTIDTDNKAYLQKGGYYEAINVSSIDPNSVKLDFSRPLLEQSDLVDYRDTMSSEAVRVGVFGTNKSPSKVDISGEKLALDEFTAKLSGKEISTITPGRAGTVPLTKLAIGDKDYFRLNLVENNYDTVVVMSYVLPRKSCYTKTVCPPVEIEGEAKGQTPSERISLDYFSTQKPVSIEGIEVSESRSRKRVYSVPAEEPTVAAPPKVDYEVEKTESGAKITFNGIEYNEIASNYFSSTEEISEPQYSMVVKSIGGEGTTPLGSISKGESLTITDYDKFHLFILDESSRFGRPSSIGGFEIGDDKVERMILSTRRNIKISGNPESFVPPVAEGSSVEDGGGGTRLR